MKLAIFEDEFSDNLNPLALTKPVYALRCGPSLLYEKALREFPSADVYLFMRDLLVETFAAKMTHKDRVRVRGINDLKALEGDDVLFVNGRWLVNKSLIAGDEEIVAVKDDVVVYAYLKKESIRKALETSRKIEEVLNWARREIGEKRLDEALMIRYPWDLVNHNSEEIKREFAKFKEKEGILPSTVKGLDVIGDEDDVFIARNAKIYPNVVFDTSHGPVIVDEGAIVYSFSIIFGPSYIGRDSWIIGGRIREGTTIGPVCRVSGEVEESIIHGYSNKYHEGFIGHSYIGEWVNLGALTTTSDLRNDYRHIKVYINGRAVDTGSIKVGSFIGDHTKIGIGTLLNTGTIIGVMCNIASSGTVPPRYIPSFIWYVKGQMSEGPGLEYMIETARIAMSRRNISLTEAEAKLFRKLHEKTREEREKILNDYKSR